MIPIPYRWAAFAASLAACYGVGYTQARHLAEVERAKVEAVAAAENSRFRKLEKEVADAQSGYVKAWSTARDAARADWLRLKAGSAGRVPVVCAESGGADTDQRDGLENARAEADRVLHAAVDALERGAEVERVLTLCQAELRQCSGMR